MDSGIGKSFGKSAGPLAAPATILRGRDSGRERFCLGCSGCAGAVGHFASLVRPQEAAKNADRVCFHLGDLHRPSYPAQFVAGLRLIDSRLEAAQLALTRLSVAWAVSRP